MSLSFLSQKSFHPSNPKNLAKLFQAEEKKTQEAKKKEELAKQFEQEEARRQVRGMVKERMGGPAEPPASMSFMYNAPPGLSEARAKVAEKKPSDRDAERFPLLKDAPRQGEYTLGLEVTHKPFGVELRKVRCTKCDAWGHQAGDRECPLRNQLDERDDARKERLDPVAGLKPGNEASGAPLRWEMKGVPGGEMHGAGSSRDVNQQFVIDNDTLGASHSLAEIDPELLAALSEKQQKKLRKMYQRELQSLTKGEEGSDADEPKKRKRKDDKKHKKKRKEEKKHKKKKSQRSDSSHESDSDSN